MAVSALGERVSGLLSGGRLFALLAILVIVAATVGSILFARSSVLPQWTIRSELAAQLISAQQQLLAARRDQSGDPDQLREQLAAAQATLEEKASVFFSTAQATEVLDRLYQYANESDVVITSLLSQTGAEPAGQEGQQEQPEGEPAPEEGQEEPPESQEPQANRVFDAQAIQLVVEGTVPNLIDFVSRIRETAYRSFVLTNVNISPGEELHTLTMNVILYTSPYSSGSTEPAGPDVTPMPTVDRSAQLTESLADAWSSEDWEQAIEIIDQILVIEPGDDYMLESLYTAHVNYGQQLLEEGDSTAASTQFILALEIKPDGAEALAGLQQTNTTPVPTVSAEAMLEQRLDEAWAAADWEEVMSLIEQILALSPDREDTTEKLYAAHINYGYKLQGEGKLEEARVEFHAALAVKPDGEEALTALQVLAGGTPQPVPSPSGDATPTPDSDGTSTIHVVQPGENLFRIALQYGTTADAIRAANGIAGNTISVGQQLTIPVP